VLFQLKLASTVTTPLAADYKKLQKSYSVRREDVYKESQAKGCTDVEVPVHGEVLIVAFEKLNNSKNLVVRKELNVKVSNQDNDSYVDKLNKRNPSKHALGLFVNCVVSFELRDLLEANADNTIDGYNYY
jgi:hypothetical protein